MTTNQSTDERQIVIFELAGQQYGVDISAVREIIRMQEVTTVPDAPPSVEGVVNLRGSVIPVVDLRKRFSLEQREATDQSRIVVVELHGTSAGIIVDAMSEVVRISADSIDPPSSIVTTDESFYIAGIARIGDELLILLDLEKALSADSLGHVADDAATPPAEVLEAA